jgi:hypothetical protein
MRTASSCARPRRRPSRRDVNVRLVLHAAVLLLLRDEEIDAELPLLAVAEVDLPRDDLRRNVLDRREGHRQRRLARSRLRLDAEDRRRAAADGDGGERRKERQAARTDD